MLPKFGAVFSLFADFSSWSIFQVALPHGRMLESSEYRISTISLDTRKLRGLRYNVTDGGEGTRSTDVGVVSTERASDELAERTVGRA